MPVLAAIGAPFREVVMSTPSSAIAQRPAAREVTALPFPARYARFGTFQADLEREELYHDGQRVRVQGKVFQGLLLLLSRAGEIVSREEVRRHLWPETLLANLDANVNTTMNKLRQVLGDSPEGPVFIETIPRRGYSFIAGVEFSSVASGPFAEGAKGILDAGASEASVRAATLGSIWSNKQVRTVLRLVSLLVAGMILGALLTLVWFIARGSNQRSAADKRLSAASVTVEFQRNSR
jgi:DNA-binding winged helix-turn-helix (wHTH) protein